VLKGQQCQHVSCEGWGSYTVCSGVVAEMPEQGYEHVICLRVASEECVQGGVEISRAEGLG
jgi:hypothetical protein